MRNLLLPTLAVLIATGCMPRQVKTDFARTQSPPRPTEPRPGERVDVFLADWPTRPFVEIGLVEVQEARGSFTASELMKELRERAGREGCEGLIFLGDNDGMWSSSSSSTSTTTTPAATPDESPSTTSTTTNDDASGMREGYRGSCVVYVDEASVARQ